MWKMKVNPKKSAHEIFTLRRDNYPYLFINNTSIPHTNTVKYLGLTLDKLNNN